MTTTNAHKTRNRLRAKLQQDFIPNFEMRSVLVIALFAASASAAHAQTSPSVQMMATPAGMTVAADRQPEKMTPARATNPTYEAAFNRADTNRDGKLSRQEAEHFPMLSQRFEAVDGNSDAFISRDEFNQAVNN